MISPQSHESAWIYFEHGSNHLGNLQIKKNTKIVVEALNGYSFLLYFICSVTGVLMVEC